MIRRGARHIGRGLRRLAADRSGASTLLTILMLPVLVGVTALAMDGGMAYVQRRSAQAAADSAAHSGATAYMLGESNVTDEARAVTAEFGFRHGVDGVAVAVNRGPASGLYAGDPTAVEVIITRPMTTFFSSLLGGTSGTIRARSVSKRGKGDVCVLILHPTQVWAVTINGSGTIRLDKCVLQVNSDHAQAMLINGSPVVEAEEIRLVGNYLANGVPELKIKNGVKADQPAVLDPYADTPVPSSGVCTHTTRKSYLSKQTFTPGTVWCDGADILADATFQPGVYFFRKTLGIHGSVKIKGDGVTFVFTDGADLTVNGASELDLKAPTTGETAGILFFSAQNSGAGNVTLNGSNKSKLTGTMYFPTKQVIVNGTNGINGDCLQLVARTVTFNGGGSFGIACRDTGVISIGGKDAGLVE